MSFDGVFVGLINREVGEHATETIFNQISHPLAFGPHNGTEQTSGLPNTVMGKRTYNYNPLKMQVKVYKPVKLLSSHSMEAAKILEKNTKNNSKNVTPQN